MTWKRLALLSALLILPSLGALAHHSGAAYDASKTLRIEGEVVAWRFANPHSSLQVRALDAAGEPLLWSFEGLPAGMLTPLGYRRNTFQASAKVTVLYNPMKDGRAGGGRLVGAVLPDGSTVGNVPPE